jgi:uncharacterized protein YdaT
MSKKNIHVVKRAEGWGLRRDNGKRDSAHRDTQGEAIERAVEIAKRDGVDVIIHRPDGAIRDRDSYGNDPHPPKDKKH